MAPVTEKRSAERRAVEGELAALVVLTRAPGIGLRSVRRLIDRHGGASEALTAARRAAPADLRALRRGQRVPTARTVRALGPDGEKAARSLLREARAKGLRLAGYTDCGEAAYPEGLRDLPDPPPVLFKRGAGALDSERTIAVVGTRASSSYGLRTAYALGRELGRWGWTVVSGMARGIDAAAHAGALDAGGRTIGVLGTGHDREYPADNRELYRRMRSHGVLLSEFEPGAPPTRSAFPRRNRVIAALARGVIVVEAGGKSGALNTADHALDLGREVLAVPGRIDDPGAAGCLRLLRQGAGLVAGVQDVFDALGWLCIESQAPRSAEGSARAVDEPSGDTRLLGALSRGPRSPDELAVGLEMPVTKVLGGLGRLELEGWVERRPGGNFAAVRRRGGP
ncbi:DNA-processing protein DprA [Candidatus Palauibacter soopunensis]|uniref:DNA-processing protein DprA n=1 Tax=Candidatus Palauibacter soopunensis TaxID=3056739 RepID=UPI002390BD36|nr:DNA-processing protein DprA [Candidatus Palauibacter soopunensis]MDE2879844.1 DNA-processing protein DprA [Candidatus Palauibacter soopunensis]